MTVTMQAAGWVVVDDAAIWGVGATEEAAWADLRNNMRLANIPHESEVDKDDTYCPRYWSEDRFAATPATGALLSEVDARGGVIAWRRVGGVACTVEEEEA